MSAKIIAKLRADLAALKSDKIEPLLSRMEAGETLTDAEKAQLSAYESEGDQINARLDELIEAETKRLANERRDLEFDKLTGASDGVEHGATLPGTGTMTVYSRPTQTLADAYLNSPTWKRYLETAKGAPGADLELAQFALISSRDAGGKPVAGYWKAADAAMPNRRTPLLDAFGSEQVGSGEFWWIEWPATAPAGSVVAEGAPIPEVAYPPVVRSGQLDKVANWLPITEEFLEDNLRMQSIIEGALADGVRQKAEADAAAALVAATLPTSPGTGTLLEEIRRGVGKVTAAGYSPETVVLHPDDYAEIDIDLLTKTLNGARAASPLWALNVVGAAAVPVGTAYVGDFLAGARVFWRAGVRIQITDSHASQFTEDKLAIKAAQRLSPKIVRPEAIVECVAVTP